MGARVHALVSESPQGAFKVLGNPQGWCRGNDFQATGGERKHDVVSGGRGT